MDVNVSITCCFAWVATAEALGLGSLHSLDLGVDALQTRMQHSMLQADAVLLFFQDSPCHDAHKPVQSAASRLHFMVDFLF